MKNHLFFAATFLVALCLYGCGRLPRNFATLPLGKQIDAYSNRFKSGGHRSLEAEELIAGHGYAAAEAMVPYIRRQKQGIPVFHAISIAWAVQIRGCDLRGTVVEDALRAAQNDPDGLEHEKQVAKLALAFVEENRHSPSFPPIPAHLCAP